MLLFLGALLGIWRIMKKYICIDIGGTAIKYCLISAEGELLESHERSSRAGEGGARLQASVREILDSYLTDPDRGALIEDAGADYGGICISTAGMVDPVSGSIFHAGPTIPDYQGTCWKRFLGEAYHLPVEVENDVNCAGLAEALSGAGRGCRSVLTLTIGTGIGAAFYLKEKGREGIYHGFSNAACEVGYMDLGEPERFEAVASTSALCRRVAEAKGESAELWDGRRIFAAAKGGDVTCIEAIDHMVDLLGRGLANLAYVLNPECIVLGGGIMKQEEYLYPRLRAALDRHLVASIAEKTRLAPAANGNRAGMLGAFYHFQLMQERT